MKTFILSMTLALTLAGAIGCSTTHKHHRYEQDTVDVEVQNPDGSVSRSPGDAPKPRRTVITEEHRSAPEIVVE